jgi:ornithine--oxo-acid transaminase
MKQQTKSDLTSRFIVKEQKYGALNYHPLPVVIEKGSGVFLWDVEGERYFDFLSAYSAVNQGHCHPRIVKAFIEQAQRVTLTSRAFYNNRLGDFEGYLCGLFGYQRALVMNTGVEAVESAMKLCRKWGYQMKGIPDNQAKIVFAKGNFHGRTLSVISASDDLSATTNFGPFTPGIVLVEYNDIDALCSLLENDKNIAGFIIEPIQGEAGVVVPDEEYLARVHSLCKKHNVLYIADEIQTGIGRTGGMVASYDIADQNSKARPDVLILGKAISGGMMPVSAVLADDEVMLCFQPGEHGSTFGGNPLACAVSKEAIQVVLDEHLSQNAQKMGEIFREGLRQMSGRYSLIKEVRGKGLLCAIVIDSSPDDTLAWEICMKLKENGLLAKPTQGNKIRFAPPLIITQEQIVESLSIIERTLANFVG